MGSHFASVGGSLYAALWIKTKTGKRFTDESATAKRPPIIFKALMPAERQSRLRTLSALPLSAKCVRRRHGYLEKVNWKIANTQLSMTGPRPTALVPIAFKQTFAEFNKAIESEKMLN